MSQSPSHANTTGENTPVTTAYYLNRFIDSRLEGFAGDAKNTLLVVVILITTATYQSGLSPPGGLWQEDSCASKETCTLSYHNVSEIHTPEHTAGTAILATRTDSNAYTLFAITNSLGFYASMYMIYILTIDYPLLLELQVSLLLFSANYAICMYTLLPTHHEKLRYFFITVGGIFVLLVMVMFFVGTTRLSERREAQVQEQERNSTGD